ncbi:MAG: DUF3775 domain-containing protein [Sphingomonadales bacterium]|nr:DUF3775 domain-containing protein [Sphingomonadales bacterium]
MLTISPEKICFILIKAREFDAKVEPMEEIPGSNPSDDRDIEILEDFKDDPTAEELSSAIESLNIDEQLDLLALVLIGRGDYAAEEWQEARREARVMRTDNIADYLMGTPNLGDLLEEGMSAFNLSCDDVNLAHL